METELDRAELINSKREARRRRVRSIRRRIATGAVILVAGFGGTILFRSLEQTTVATEDTGRVASVFGGDEEDTSEGFASPSVPSGTEMTTQAPLVTSQS